jgi:hypothetical protein
MIKYYALHAGKNWMSDTVTQIAHLKQDKRDLQDEVDELKKDIQEAYILENGETLSLNDLRIFYYEHKKDSAVEEEQRDIVIRLRQEIAALNHNMDHAYNLGNGKFLTLDDLHDFYEDNKKVHNLVESLRNKIVLLELELKQLQKPKNESFATNTEDKFAERAKINQEKQNVKFEGYTEGFWKGFDMGYNKARDQLYE